MKAEVEVELTIIPTKRMSLDGILEPFKRLSNKRLKMEWPLTIIVTIFFDFFLDFYFIQNINNKHLF